MGANIGVSRDSYMHMYIHIYIYIHTRSYSYTGIIGEIPSNGENHMDKSMEHESEIGVIY